jgi:predicted house-cleaning noncanonical NTP pyrophosphatase (MazG superfamily)
MKKFYNKLVRDNVPKTLLKGKSPVIRKIKDEKEYFAYVKQELGNRLAEFYDENDPYRRLTVLSDIRTLLGEYVPVLQKQSGYSFSEVHESIFKKLGNYENKIVVKTIEEDAGVFRPKDDAYYLGDVTEEKTKAASDYQLLAEFNYYKSFIRIWGDIPGNEERTHQAKLRMEYIRPFLRERKLNVATYSKMVADKNRARKVGDDEAIRAILEKKTEDKKIVEPEGERNIK